MASSKEPNMPRQTKFIHVPASYKEPGNLQEESNDAVAISDNDKQPDHPPFDCVSQGIAAAIPVLVAAGRDTELKLLLNNENNLPQLEQCSWEVVTPLCTLLSTEQTPMVLHLCDLTLKKLADVANPKELLLGLLEQTDTFIEDIKLYTLMTPIQKCILRLTKKRGHSLALTLETLYAHIELLEIPEREANLEGKEEMLVHETEAMKQIVEKCSAMVEFLQPFADDLMPKLLKETERMQHEKEIVEIITFLLRLLAKPLVHLDLKLYWRGSAETLPAKLDRNNPQVHVTEVYMLAEQIVKMLGMMNGNYAALIEKIIKQNKQRSFKKAQRTARHQHENDSMELELDDDPVDEIIPELGLACLAYLTLGEGLSMSAYPQVYTSLHDFILILPLASQLLESKKHTVQEKGVSLLFSTLGKLDEGSVDLKSLETCGIASVFDKLVTIVIHCQNRSLQQRGLKNIPLLLHACCDGSKVVLLKNLLKKYKHSGFKGFVIGQVKQLISSTQASQVCFTANQLHGLYQNIFILEDGAETNLIDNSDVVISALNFLRYMLILGSGKENDTKLGAVLGQIKTTYLGDLRRGIDMSRAHYELDLDNLVNDKVTDMQKTMSFTVGDENMPMLDKSQKIKVYQNALNTFDLIDSILARVVELADTY